MSLNDKLQAFKRDVLAEIKKKETELKNLKSSVDNTIAQARNEIQAESERINSSSRALINEEERIKKYRSKTEQELEHLRRTTEIRINRHISNVIEWFEQLESYGKDPKLIDAYINACYALDEKLAIYFEEKPRPATNTAETIRAYKKENHRYLQRIKELEYQISELWAQDTDTSEKEAFEYFDNDEARTRYFLSSNEYSSLSESERNQRALDNYLKKRHSKAHIGKMYERYIGYLYEQKGYKVEYRGIELGLKDGGIDLVCKKKGEVLLVQCKNWKQESTIYEKHICQLYGASKFYDKDYIQKEYAGSLFADIDWNRVTPVFVTTTRLDEHAISVADALGVKVEYIDFNKSYPIIKCNINEGVRIYHLPIDQMYDRTKVCKPGEFYAMTVEEAEKAGFRRAFKHFVGKA